MSKNENKKQSNSIIKWLVVLISLVIIVSQIIHYQLLDKNLHIYFLNVGQGDSIYARKMNNFDLLIDGGPNSKVLSELGIVMPFWDHEIDYIILTHPHADHISGLIEVIKRYQVGQILATDAVTATNEYQEFLKLVKEKDVPYRLVRTGDEFVLDSEVKLNIFWPNYSFSDRKINNLNNTSIVAKLSYNNFSVLFTGDAESEVQLKLLAISDKLLATILKVPHHGSKNGGNQEFFQAVNPKISVICVGKNNMFGHPTKFTLDLLKSINSQIYRTDQNGRVEIISDGQTFWTKSEK